MRFRLGVLFALFILFCMLNIRSASAQGMASMTGRVTDQGGLVAVGAKVGLVNVNTGATYSTVTTDAGLYNFPTIEPGTYRMTVTMEGFKEVVRTNVEIHAADALAFNFTLEVGAVSQSVTVEGTAPVVNTSNSSLGGLVNDEKMSDLPLNGRNFVDLTLLQPGITQKVISGTTGMAGTWFSSNGAPTQSNNYTLDGTPMVNGRGGVTGSISGNTLGVDGIKEYKLITNNFGAEYGMAMGSQMVIVSKGGTNNWHGDAFEYLRNSSLNARNYFDSPADTPAGKRIPEFQQNNFGGSFGGPIKKDKMFFYAVFEELKANVGFTANDVVPNVNCPRSASNPNLVSAGTDSHGYAAYNFATDAAAKACNSALVGIGGTGTVTPIEARMLPFMNLYPNPNNAATGYSTPLTETQLDDFGQIRVDRNFGNSDLIFARFTIDNASFVNPSGVATSFTGVGYQDDYIAGSSRNIFLTAAENHIFSPTLLNQLRLSYSRVGYTDNTYFDSKLADPAVLLAPNATVVGGVGVTGFSSAPGVGINSTGPPPPRNILNTLSLADDIFYTHGKHALKFGTLFNHVEDGMQFFLYLNGSISFPSLSSFYQGLSSAYTLQLPGVTPSVFNKDYRWDTLGFYVQDDYRATSRLTLNLGLRYEFNTTVTELNNRSYYFPNIRTSPEPGVQGSPFTNPSFKNFSPRVGFAYDPTGSGKTAIRGGFGIYYDVGNYGGPLTQQGYGMPPLTGFGQVGNPGAGSTFTLPLTFPTTGVPGGIAISMQTADHVIQQPHELEWSLTIDRQLPGGLGLTVSYVGSRGIHLWTQGEDGNPTIPTAVVNGVEYWGSNIVGIAGCDIILPTCRHNPTISRVNLDATNADSNYHGLQVSVIKHLAKGLEFQSAYTYSHALDDTSGQLGPADCGGSGEVFRVDEDNPKNTYGPSCSDLTHNWQFNLTYHLPGIKSSSFVSKLTNGWWVANIISVHTGYPFTPVLGGNRSQSGNNNGQADNANVNTAALIAANPCSSTNPCAYTPIPFDEGSVYTQGGDGAKVAHWFNPAMFSMSNMVLCPGSTTVTCGVLGIAQRGMLRGPGEENWNFTLAKDTHLSFLGESGGLQFRAEVFNLTNRPNFGMPTGTVFTGTTGNALSAPSTSNPTTMFSQATFATAGNITSTITTARQIQLALKLIF